MKIKIASYLCQLYIIASFIILPQNYIFAQNQTPVVISTPPSSPFGPPNQYSTFYHEIKVEDDEPTVDFKIIKLPTWLQAYKGLPKSLFIQGTCENLQTDSVVVSISDSIHTIRYGFQVTVRPLYDTPWFQISHDVEAFVDSIFNFPVKVQIGGVDRQLIQLVCVSKPNWLNFENSISPSDLILYGKLTGIPSAEGIYQVQLTAKYGLTNPMDENFILNITVKKSNTAVKITTNDNRMVFDTLSKFIRFANEMYRIEVSEVSGRLVASGNFIKELDVSAIPNGVLLVKYINSSGDTHITKFIKR